MRSPFHALVALIAIVLTSCVRFEPKPLAPAQTAAELQTRTLTNAALQEFLSANLPHPLTNWPAATWDLDMLTLAAYYYHPSLEVARADWRVAQGGETTAAARPNPTVTASAAYEPAADAFSPWIPGLVFDLPIETAGKRRLRMDQARHLSDAARFNLAATAWQVRSNVRTSVVEFVAAEQRVDLLQEQIALREDFAGRLERQFEAGAISAFERNTARLTLIRARADLADAQRSLAEARPQIAGALGIPAAALDGVSIHLDLGPTPAAQELTTTQMRDWALRGRSDILAALADYAASQSALQLEVARQYPDIRLAPGYSWNAASAGEHDWQLGVTVELPILNQNQGPIAEASARRDASAARFRALQSKIIGDIDAAVASFRAGHTNVAALNSLVTSQTAQQRLVQQQLAAGAADRLDLLTATLELNAVHQVELDAVVKLHLAVAALEDAVQRPIDLPVFSTPQNSQALAKSPH
jgi:outer membrane protein TolC